MVLSIEARYLQIEWQDHGRARTVNVAPEPIEITELDDGTLVAETQVFHDLCPWVGLRLSDNLVDIEPAFEAADGSLNPMLQLEDGTGTRWWVQNDGWDSSSKRHLSEMHRSMGQFTVALGPYRLKLNNIVDRLGRVEVEEYLRDFQQDLIWLVMGFGGATAVAQRGGIVNREMIDALEAFTAASRRVLANPARDVREVQINSRPARLRPNSATFRQYLRTPTAQRLRGRGTEETADIADNRYLHHMVQICGKLSQRLAQSVEQHAKRFADRARIEADRSAAYSNMTHREIDPEVFDRQLSDLEKKLARVAACADASSTLEDAANRLEFRPGKLYGDQLDTIFYNNRDESKASGEHKGIRYEYSTLRTSNELVQALQSTQNFCDYYSLEGIGRAVLKQTQKGKAYREVHFTRIYSAMPVTRAIDRKKDRRAFLEKNNWLALLTEKERQENEHEAHTALLRGKAFQQYFQQTALGSFALHACQVELRAQAHEWETMSVASSALLPMSVRFSQSPHYAACQVAFSRMMQLSHSNGIEMDTLDAIDRIGILHASALYERWCLVKILGVLMENYRFKPEAGWQEQLVRAITGKPESVKLGLHRDDVGMSACLEVQPVLPNGRRPDFRLRFFYDKDQPVSVLNRKNAARDGQAETSPNTESSAPWIVLDAKFRSRWQRSELGQMLRSLINEKEYGQQRDRVFILHPAPKSILKPTSPLSWGRDCDYGQEAGEGHAHGVVYLAPGSGERNSETNLQRLIAMQLQSTFPVPLVSQPDDDDRKNHSFCISCGCAHRRQDVEQQLTRRGKIFWILSCSECAMQTTRTHCYGCNEGILFKNGLNLTFHRTVADQITNIVCPKCGNYFDNDVHGKGSE